MLVLDTTSSDADTATNTNTPLAEPQIVSLSHPRAILITVLICTEQVLEGILMSMIAPILPSYATAHNASQIDIAVLFAMFPLAVLATSALFGRLSGRFGRKPFIYFGVLLSGVTTILFGLESNISLLFLYRFLAGAGSASSWSAIYALLHDVFPTHFTRVMGFTEVAAGIGAMVGPAVAALLASALGFAWPFIIVGTLLLLLVALLPFTLSKAFIDKQVQEGAKIIARRSSQYTARRQSRMSQSKQTNAQTQGQTPGQAQTPSRGRTRSRSRSRSFTPASEAIYKLWLKIVDNRVIILCVLNILVAEIALTVRVCLSLCLPLLLRLIRSLCACVCRV